ncbi:hypothetical protein MJO28_012005 [Puccinia striiformis f. sp. tritici]|uniref:Uncharacterized protein n=1 Tax=Puccinia striiformis f. sp. tritici TaxID=168172 RepID=A0ACC0DYR6_9BASI|nr:hypothetical protein Pst134EB_023968 [Puccinia striiformis f. sp. tritici]KAI7941978.1 hypothetical protein MJO28_012005 [Puccinia striiformis f. sp. tritici]KAI9623696.1 hypothetical protein H4Q26_014423 [Puccinia striiformis f. sp. tritici PST-130]
MQFRFNRVPSYDQGETSNSSSSIHRTTSRDLRKARSTPILRINEGGVTDARNPPRRPSAVSRLNSIAEAVEGPTVLTRPAASTLTLGRAAWPSQSPVSDQASTRHGSFTRKIRHRLSSFGSRTPGVTFPQQGSCPFRADKSKAPSSKPTNLSLIDPTRDVFPSTMRFTASPIRESSAMAMRFTASPIRESSVMAMRFTASPIRESSAMLGCSFRDQSNDMIMEPKSPSYASSMTALKGGFNKAHRFLGRALEGFSDKECDEDAGNDSYDEDEDDLNMLYSNVMVPLEFPDEEDGETTSSSASSTPYEPHFDNNSPKNTISEDQNPGYKQLSSCLSDGNPFFVSAI